MIVGSVLLVVAALVLLTFGLIHLDEPLLYSSIALSALAAFVLFFGVRRLAAVRAGRGTIAVRLAPTAVGRARPRVIGRAAVTPRAVEEGDPPVETVPELELTRLSGTDAKVVVVDDHPRFHRATCPHAADPDAEEIAVAEAVELGFTPCGACRPVATLLS